MEQAVFYNNTADTSENYSLYKKTTLDKLEVGKSATVYSLEAKGAKRRRFLDLGLIEGTNVAAVLKSPFGDPIAYSIRGAVIAIRSEDAKNIKISY